MKGYDSGMVLLRKTTSGRNLSYRVIAAESDGAWLARRRTNTSTARFLTYEELGRDFVRVDSDRV